MENASAKEENILKELEDGFQEFKKAHEKLDKFFQEHVHQGRIDPSDDTMYRHLHDTFHKALRKFEEMLDRHFNILRNKQ